MAEIVAGLIFVAVSCVVIVYAGGGPVLFLHRPVGVVYLVLWAAWLGTTVLWRRRGERTKYDRRQGPVVILMGIFAIPLLMIAPPWEYAHFSGPIPRDTALAWFGLGLHGLGIVFQSLAMLALRGSYTVHLGVQEGQQLVTGGLYHLVRHPGYLGYLLSLLGIGLAMSSLIALAIAVLIVPFLVWRIREEERMLVDVFGDRYERYRRGTRYRLVPLVY